MTSPATRRGWLLWLPMGLSGGRDRDRLRRGGARGGGWSAAACVTGLLALAACGGPLGAVTPATATTGAGASGAATLPAFYRTPVDLAVAPAGSVIRSEAIAAGPSLPAGTRAYRVLYHSRSIDGSDLVVSGMVVVPPGCPAPGRLPCRRLRPRHHRPFRPVCPLGGGGRDHPRPGRPDRRANRGGGHRLPGPRHQRSPPLPGGSERRPERPRLGTGGPLPPRRRGLQFRGAARLLPGGPSGALRRTDRRRLRPRAVHRRGGGGGTGVLSRRTGPRRSGRRPRR